MSKLQSQINELESYIDKHECTNASVSKSTVAWQIEHTLLTINQVIQTVKKSNPDNYKWTFNWKRMLIMNILKKIPRGKAKAPKQVVPEAIITKESLQNHINKARENMLLIENFQPYNYFEHPFFGKLHVHNTLKFLALHTQHHIDIIRDIIK